MHYHMRLVAITCSEPPGMFLRKHILQEVRSTHHFRNYTPDQGPVSIVLGGQTIYVRLVRNR